MNLILHEDTVYETVESKYYTGHQPVKIVKGEPALSWKGGKIPMDEWSKILSFFKWSYDETQSETQVRLLYNPEENKWVAWAFPQEHGTGMTTKEIDGELKDKQREQFSGYIVNGTVHHHCSSPAFQSGTDKTDEESQDGLHITIGNLTSSMYDLHTRVCRSDIMYKCSLKEWFEFPDEWSGILPARFINHAVADVLITPPETPGFPEGKPHQGYQACCSLLRGRWSCSQQQLLEGVRSLPKQPNKVQLSSGNPGCILCAAETSTNLH